MMEESSFVLSANPLSSRNYRSTTQHVYVCMHACAYENVSMMKIHITQTKRLVPELNGADGLLSPGRRISCIYVYRVVITATLIVIIDSA